MSKKHLIVLIFLIPILIPISFSQTACDPIKCSEQSQLTGNRYCRDGDAYSSYREYYCSSNECVSRSSEKLIEQCNFGCSVGICITCNRTECEAKSGFYGGKFCRANDVRGTYREYSCSSIQGCTFTETERTVETCKDSTCTDGRCGLCDPSVCNSQDGFYDDEFCNIDRDVYKVYRDYSCDLDRCIFKRTEIKLADCSFNCDTGKCTATVCDAGCDSKDGYSGQPYCKGNDIYRKYRDYFCALNACDFNETERKIESCSSVCSSGACAAAPKVSNERFFEFNLSFSNTTEDIRITRLPDRIYNGFLFGKNDIAVNVDAFLTSLNFTVTGTNKLGILEVAADDSAALTVSEKGSYSVKINKYAKSVKISTTSSGFVFWVPALYDVSNMELMAKKTKINENKFSFLLGPEYTNFRYGDIAMPENITVLLNGNMATKSFSKSLLKFGDNEIVFVPQKPLQAKAGIRISYEE